MQHTSTHRACGTGGEVRSQPRHNFADAGRLLQFDRLLGESESPAGDKKCPPASRDADGQSLP
jgi:hypothetical protein